MSSGKPSDQQNLSVPVITPDETSSVRKRVQTEEGRAHEIDLLAKQLNACYKRLKRQCSLFGELLLSDDVDMVHTECNNLDRLLSEAKSIHDRLLTLLDCSAHAALLNSNEEIDGMVFSIKQQACSWLKSQDAGSRSRKTSAQDRRSRHSGSQAACSKTVPVFPDEEEKDQAYELDLLAKQLNACYNRLKRQCNLFSELLLSDDVNMVHTECANLDRLLSEAQSIHDRLLTLSDISARVALLKSHEEIDGMVFSIKQQACSWLKSQEAGTRSRRSSTQGRRSLHSSPQAGKKGNRSTSKCPSDASDSKLRIVSLQEEQKKIEELKRAKGRELESKLHHETAKLDTREILITQQLRQAKMEEELSQLADAKIKEPVYNSKSKDADDNDVLNVMKQLISLQTAPDVDIDVFSGNPLDFRYFRTTFRESVEKKVPDARSRLTRLLKYIC